MRYAIILVLALFLGGGVVQSAHAQEIKEKDLYPWLNKFVKSEFQVYGKRIDEKRTRDRSRGRGGNKWLHPDLVGMRDLSESWDPEIKGLVDEYGDRKTSLWSFEVKLEISNSNVRESFFQTVANSSWANYSYLVAYKITDKEAEEELRTLSALHGVGFILIRDIPSRSQIVIPARKRDAIDWDATNRLAEANRDFHDYIKSVRYFYQTGNIRPDDWRADGE